MVTIEKILLTIEKISPTIEKILRPIILISVILVVVAYFVIMIWAFFNHQSNLETLKWQLAELRVAEIAASVPRVRPGTRTNVKTALAADRKAASQPAQLVAAAAQQPKPPSDAELKALMGGCFDSNTITFLVAVITILVTTVAGYLLYEIAKQMRTVEEYVRFHMDITRVPVFAFNLIQARMLARLASAHPDETSIAGLREQCSRARELMDKAEKEGHGYDESICGSLFDLSADVMAEMSRIDRKRFDVQKAHGDMAYINESLRAREFSKEYDRKVKAFLRT